jgi:MFS family permease
MAASALCGIAGSLTTLIAFRALQGIGGGIVIASVFAGVPELFSPAARTRLVGLFTGTFGLASVVGPLLGGVLTDTVGWRSVFLINLPFGVIAMLGLMAAYPSRPPASGKLPIDYFGALTLVGGVGSILTGVSLGGRDLAWTSAPELGLLGVGLLLIFAFIRVEAQAADPIIPLQAMRSRALGIPTLSMGFMAMGMFSTGLFVPLFVQGVLGRGAAGSGTVLAPLMLSFVAGSVASSQLISRVGHYRLMGVGSMTIGALGLVLLSTMGPATSDAEMVRNLIVAGLGLGSSLSALAIANQSSVPLAQVGMANALGAFARSLGGTIGSAGLGAIVAQATGAVPGALPAPDVLAAALRTTFLAATLAVIAGGLLALLIKEMALGEIEAPPVTTEAMCAERSLPELVAEAS